MYQSSFHDTWKVKIVITASASPWLCLPLLESHFLPGHYSGNHRSLSLTPGALGSKYTNDPKRTSMHSRGSTSSLIEQGSIGTTTPRSTPVTPRYNLLWELCSHEDLHDIKQPGCGCQLYAPFRLVLIFRLKTTLPPKKSFTYRTRMSK